MQNIIKCISLDLNEAESRQIVSVKENDAGRNIIINLNQSGRPYFVDDDCRAVVAGTRPDGFVFFNDAEIDNGRVLYTITELNTQATGIVNAELRLYGPGGELIATPSFSIKVTESAVEDGEVLEGAEATALTKLIETTIALEITAAEVTVDNNVGTPTGSAELTPQAGGGRILKLDFKNLKGLPGDNSVVVDGKMEKLNPEGTGKFRFNAPDDFPNGFHAVSFGGVASGVSSFAEGFDTTASGGYSHAEGNGTVAEGSGSHAEGNGTTASGIGSHAEGYETTASKAYSHAEGYRTTASKDYSHAEGNGTTASGIGSHAEGFDTTASGGYSHAEGYETTASKDYSHAEGFRTTAGEPAAHAEGYRTAASGIGSHAEGFGTTASGGYSHAEGNGTVAEGSGSHAEGSGTVAATGSQHVQGTYNIKDEKGIYAHILGSGRSEELPANAHTIDWNGNAWFSGDVFVGSTSRTNKDEGSKKLATEEYVNLAVAAGGGSGGGAGGYVIRVPAEDFSVDDLSDPPLVTINLSESYDNFAPLWYSGGNLYLDLANDPTLGGLGTLAYIPILFAAFAPELGGFLMAALNFLSQGTYQIFASNGTWTPPTA